MRHSLFFGLVMALFFAGCASKALPPVVVPIPTRTIDYQKEVKPILDKRCTVCHSCYNSPCQLKLDSFEGADRGATKKAIYNAARYLRHVTLTDVSTPFQDCPGCLDYFPEAMSANPPEFTGMSTHLSFVAP